MAQWLLLSMGILLVVAGVATVLRLRRVIFGLVSVVIGVVLLIDGYWAGAEIHQGGNVTPRSGQPTVPPSESRGISHPNNPQRPW